METALQQLKEWVEHHPLFGSDDHKELEDKIQSLIPLEKEQHEAAFIAGLSEMQRRNAYFPDTSKNKHFDDYYTQTYQSK